MFQLLRLFQMLWVFVGDGDVLWVSNNAYEQIKLVTIQAAGRDQPMVVNEISW